MNENTGYLQGLLAERAGYINNPDKKDRLAAVDAELARFGVAVGKEGEVDMPDELQAELQAELAPVDAGAVETVTLETADSTPPKPARGRAGKPKPSQK